MAGRTMENVGHTDPVSYTGSTPSGRTSRPFLSKHAVTILYAPPRMPAPSPPGACSMPKAPRPPRTCSCTWSRGSPRHITRVTNAHSVTSGPSQVSGTTIHAS